MNKYSLSVIAAVGLIAAATTSASALCRPGAAATGAGTGAATGAIVGGPVGAAAGAVIGGVVGAATLPPRSCTYVMETRVDPVTIQSQIVVGQPIPRTVVLHPIPETQAYAFAYVNGQRVIVDPKTYVVVEVVAQ